jgi:hypothetical protein
MNYNEKEILFEKETKKELFYIFKTREKKTRQKSGEI